MMKSIFLFLLLIVCLSCEDAKTTDMGKSNIDQMVEMDLSQKTDLSSNLDQSVSMDLSQKIDLSNNLDQSINLDQANTDDQLFDQALVLEDQGLLNDQTRTDMITDQMLLSSKPWSDVPDLSRELVHDLINHSSLSALSYRFYWPSHFNTENHGDVPVLIALHGCLMSPEDMANVTQFNRMAEHLGFAVIYPEQSTLNNLSRCWNWFFTSNQGTDQHEIGEAAQILKIVDDLSTQYPIQKNNLWVAGISAGASMANILGVCYHSRVKKVLSVAGIAFGLANHLQEAQNVLAGNGQIDPKAQARLGYACEMPTRNAVKSMVVQGRQDQTVHPHNAQKIIQQMITLNDLLDDTIENQSVSEAQLIRQDHMVMGGYAYHISSLDQLEANASIVFVDIEQMGHAWSGGQAGLAFSDHLGPQVAWWFVADF